MRPVSMDDVFKAMYGRRSLPARAVLLTFDDGHRSLLEAELALLRERGFPATPPSSSPGYRHRPALLVD